MSPTDFGFSQQRGEHGEHTVSALMHAIMIAIPSVLASG